MKKLNKNELRTVNGGAQRVVITRELKAALAKQNVDTVLGGTIIITGGTIGDKIGTITKGETVAIIGATGAAKKELVVRKAEADILSRR